MNDVLPQRVLAWYGDDFTGSTDVLEMLSLHGLRSVLFLAQPGAALLERFSGYRAFGLAGSSRSQSPEWMDQHLPPAFEWLASLGAPVCHYKVCSTFDSSPEIGNIGRALDVGRLVIGSPWSPIIAGAPILGRYTVFGHLFATADDVVHRIDRHPTMSCHPVTPMHETDLRVHLSHQTRQRIGLVNFVELTGADPAAALDKAAAESDAVLLDVMDESTLIAVGRLLWREAQRRQLFVVGSSGVEHSLAAGWKADGLYDAPIQKPALQPVDRLLVLSGSCSPITANQIAYALQRGFAGVRLDAVALAGGDGREQAIENAVAQATAALEQGASAIIYSAAGPKDHLPREIASQPGFREALGRMSGLVLAAVLDRTQVRRLVVAGGDTSSHAGGRLSIDALTFVCSFTPGSPLCRAWSANPRRDKLEIVFKGGQNGPKDFFLTVRGGKKK